ncbi:hypothetical protein ACVW00_000915 [Marmoricola sp. URHA0025 HA25]
MATGGSGYRAGMPGDDDGLTPDAAPVEGSDEHTRIADKERFAGKPELEGVPDEGGVGDADVDDETFEEGSAGAGNRADVPPAPENTLEARTEDGAEDEITRP